MSYIDDASLYNHVLEIYDLPGYRMLPFSFFHFAAPSRHALHVPTDGFSLGDVLIILGGRRGTQRSSRRTFPRCL